MITVVAALIKKGNKVLIARRLTGDENVMGKWEFPGGKVEPGETKEHAIEREILEEFELSIIANGFVANNVCEYPKKTIDLRLYKCEYLSGIINLHDHSEYKWIEAKNLLNYDLAPADIPLVKYIMED
jgi:8-oxo-dGTP diphosphatase